MKKSVSKAAAVIMLTLFLLSILSTTFIAFVKAQSSVDSSTVGLWHLDEVVPADYREVTPDATGKNPATLVKAPKAPVLVEGKFDKAMEFDGNNGVYVPIRFLVGFPPSPQPIYIPVSTSLDVPEEIRIEAWINVHAFKNVTYNNIVVKCTRTDASSENTTRIYGLAVKAGLPENGYTVPKGALSGCVFTDAGGFNEIVTTEPVVPLNEWVHVAFTRSLDTGMHLYVNGVEKSVKAVYGVQNPKGTIREGTEVYFGHDAEVTIDEVRISNLAPEAQAVLSQIDIGPNMLVALVVVTVIMAVALVLRRAIQMWAIRSRSQN
jgi:hypothetical protein